VLSLTIDTEPKLDGMAAVSGVPNDGALEDEATLGAKRKRSRTANRDTPVAKPKRSRAKPNKTAVTTTESQ
jgi:hypothetical protein